MTRTKSRQTGTHIIVDRADDPSEGWNTICDEHSTVISHPTKKLATWHASDPLGWCETCMAIHEAMANEQREYVEGQGWVVTKPRGPHLLQYVSRVHLGGSPIQGGGEFYGSAGRCQCGERFKTNECSPSNGGEKIIREMHKGHVTREVLASGSV